MKQWYQILNPHFFLERRPVRTYTYEYRFSGQLWCVFYVQSTLIDIRIRANEKEIVSSD